MTRILALSLALSFTTAAHAAPIDNSDGFWSEWSDATFARAAREKKFVIMSLQSWWCRWCHVMNQETWSNAEVRGILKDKFIPVYVDQDSRPDISQRYERWGWPAGMVGQAARASSPISTSTIRIFLTDPRRSPARRHSAPIR